MTYSNAIAVVLTAAVCATAFASDAVAQSRGRSSGGRGPAVGRAVPRGEGARTQAPRNGGPRMQAPRSGGTRMQAPRGGGRYEGGRYGSRGVPPRVIGRAPLRSYYYPYSYYGYRPGFSYGYRPGFSLGLSYGYPYRYGYYGYPYGAYGYSYGGYYPSGYGYGGYGGYGYGGYVVPRADYSGAGYGGIRIQGAPRDAQVFVDGHYAGIVDDYDGTFQSLDLEPGSHEVEIRTAGGPLTYDVNVTPGQTITIHANVR